MLRKATLAIGASRTSMKVAIEITTATSQGLRFPAADRLRSSGTSGCSPMLLIGPSRTELQTFPGLRNVGRIIEDDLHGDALHHLHVIAGGILRRQQTEGRTAASLNAIDMACKDPARIGVDADIDRLPGAHQTELSLLEIRGNPDLRWDQHQQRLPGLGIIAFGGR